MSNNTTDLAGCHGYSRASATPPRTLPCHLDPRKVLINQIERNPILSSENEYCTIWRGETVTMDVTRSIRIVDGIDVSITGPEPTGFLPSLHSIEVSID